MPYTRLFYHLIWATKGRQPLVSRDICPRLYGCMAAKCKELGAVVHAMGGTEDHVHMAVTVPANIALSEFIRNVKGASSHFANHELSLPAVFAWQSEYGLISIDSKQLRGLVEYIMDQSGRHREKTTISILERC